MATITSNRCIETERVTIFKGHPEVNAVGNWTLTTKLI